MQQMRSTETSVKFYQTILRHYRRQFSYLKQIRILQYIRDVNWFLQEFAFVTSVWKTVELSKMNTCYSLFKISQRIKRQSLVPRVFLENKNSLREYAQHSNNRAFVKSFIFRISPNVRRGFFLKWLFVRKRSRLIFGSLRINIISSLLAIFRTKCHIQFSYKGFFSHWKNRGSHYVRVYTVFPNPQLGQWAWPRFCKFWSDMFIVMWAVNLWDF
jgi:hypothetical protein